MTPVISPPVSETRIDIPEVVRVKLIALLNQALATALDLKTQVKSAHWNVKGPSFQSLHELFDVLAGELEDHIDTLAERATALGGVALGTARLAVQASILPEYPLDARKGLDHVTALAQRYALFAKQLRDFIDEADELDDDGTQDLFTEVSRSIDKRLWFLEAHLQER